MGESTRAIRATLAEARTGEPLHAGPVFAGPFHVAGDPAGAAYSYARSHNPTWAALEHAIGVLEVTGGEPAGVRVFGSGMAAVAAVFGAVLRAGDTVVLQSGMYFTARQLLEERFVPLGVKVKVVPAAELAGSLEGARLAWVETPSNPQLEVTDIAAVVKAARSAGALVAVDNTTATPLGQRPLELGADFSVSSDSKSMCGHSDLVLGHVAVREALLLERIDRERTLTGGVAGPMEAWLLLRSLATLPLRLERSSANALGIAEFLSRSKKVGRVVYPGLKGHPGHRVAKAQMQFYGAVLGFELKSKKAAERFLERAKLVTQATSFGGIATTAERRGRWGHDDVPAGFIRMSAGCEDLDDLIADVGRLCMGLERGGFERAWTAEVLRAAPLIAPARSYVWPQAIAGEEDALARGALRLMVKPSEGGSYLVTAALGFADTSMVSGVFGCPDAKWMCAVAGGYAYVADTLAPERCTLLEMKPVVAVHEAVEAGVLVLVGFHAVMAWGRDGVAWTSKRVSWEGIRVTAVEGVEMRGLGWDLMADKEREFRMDLRTGEFNGGGYRG